MHAAQSEEKLRRAIREELDRILGPEGGDNPEDPVQKRKAGDFDLVALSRIGSFLK